MTASFDFLSARKGIFNSGLSSQSKLVLLVLVEHMPNAFPSLARLASWAGLSTRQAIREVQRLEGLGAVQVKRAAGISNSYSLTSDWLSLLPANTVHTRVTSNPCLPVTSDSQSLVTPSHQCPPVTGTSDCQSRVPVTASHPKQEGKQEEKQSETDLNLYHHHKDLKAGARAYASACPSPPPAVVVVVGEREGEAEAEPCREPASSPRHVAFSPSEATSGATDTTPTSERQTDALADASPQALVTRRQRALTDLSELSISDLAKRWRENPTWVAESAPQQRIELSSAALAWDNAVGLTHRPLGHPGRDYSTRALLELFADGVTLGELLVACKQAAKSDWICGREPGRRGEAPRKRRIDCLSHAVLRRLLDDAEASKPKPSPRVAEMLRQEEIRRKEAGL